MLESTGSSIDFIMLGWKGDKSKIPFEPDVVVNTDKTNAHSKLYRHNAAKFEGEIMPRGGSGRNIYDSKKVSSHAVEFVPQAACFCFPLSPAPSARLTEANKKRKTNTSTEREGLTPNR